MGDRFLSQGVSIDDRSKQAFSRHLRDNSSSRRVCQSDKENHQWLTNPLKRPTSQSDFSRRNYVRRSFIWEFESQKLLAKAKGEKDVQRVVIFDDEIADIVEWVHESNGHAEWDSTWREISTSYYGILRSDVIYLLKEHRICARDPSKRPEKRNDDSPHPISPARKAHLEQSQ